MNKKNSDRLLTLIEFIQQDFQNITSHSKRHQTLVEAVHIFGQSDFLIQKDDLFNWEDMVRYCDRALVLCDVIYDATCVNGYIFFDRGASLHCNKSRYSEYNQTSVSVYGKS